MEFSEKKNDFCTFFSELEYGIKEDVNPQNLHLNNEEEAFLTTTSFGGRITEVNIEKIKPNINTGNSISFSPLLYQMFSFIGIKPNLDSNTHLPQIYENSRLFSSKPLFKTKMIFCPNFRSLVPLNEHYYGLATFYNFYIFYANTKTFCYIIRAQNSYSYKSTFITKEIIDIYEDGLILWDKRVYYIVLDLKSLFTPMCFSIKHRPYFKRIERGFGTILLQSINLQKYLIVFDDNAFFIHKDENENFIPEFKIKPPDSCSSFFFLKNDTSAIHNSLKLETYKFFNVKKRKVRMIKNSKYIVRNTIKNLNGTIISDNFKGIKQLKEKCKNFLWHNLSTIDQKGKIFCYQNDDTFYIFNKNRILLSFKNNDGVSCILLNKHFYKMNTFVTFHKNNNFSCIYDGKTKKTEYFPVQKVVNEIFWYCGKPHYILTTYRELKVISFENNKELISFNTDEYGIISTVIIGPNNWLISLTVQEIITNVKSYLCIWGVNEKKLVKALLLDSPIFSFS